MSDIGAHGDGDPNWNAGNLDQLKDLAHHPPNAPFLKRHHSQELERPRQPKIPRGTPSTNEIPSSSAMIPAVNLDDSIVKPATTYMSLKQQPDHSAEATELGFELYQTIINVICDLQSYQQFLDYRGESAQVLIDTIQSLLDGGFVEQQFRNICILALTALAIQSRLFPRRFVLNGVTYQTSEVRERYGYCSAKGSIEGKAVHIRFMNIEQEEQDWFCNIMLWGQLSHKNVLPLYGLCPTDDKDYFPGLVTPWLENGEIYTFLRRNPGVDRRLLVSDIAAGMAHLHDHGLICGDLHLQNILITDSIPPRAYHGWHDIKIDPATLAVWQVDDRNKFLEIHRQLGMFYNYRISQAHDVEDFSIICRLIFTNYMDQFDDGISVSKHPDILSGHVREGLDDHMQQLLLDCCMKDLSARPTAHEIVQRLDQGHEHWKMALVAQEHETSFIVNSAMVYLLLEQSGNGSEVANQASKLYQSFLDMFWDLTRYGYLLSCRGEHAQVLIDGMQALLDHDGIVEQKFRNIFILSLVALCLHSQLYPKCFILHNVTYQVEDTMGLSKSVKGFMGEQTVHIEFVTRMHASKNWFCHVILWNQLSHKNVLPFYGLCQIDDEDCFPGIVTPWHENINNFLESNLDPVTRRSLISDIAVGLGYLYSNGLGRWWIEMKNVIVIDTNPPHACFTTSSLTVNAIDLTSEALWSVKDKDRFLQIHHQLDLLGSNNTTFDAARFSQVAIEILSANQPSLTWFAEDLNDMVFKGKNMPVGYLVEGLDEHLWQLLQDCGMQDSNARPTAQEIVERLEGARVHWEMALVIQTYDTKVIVESAIAYLSLKQSDNKAELANEAFKLYHSFLDVFWDLTRYRHFLGCRGEHAQILIDIMQDLLDNGIVEQQFRNVFILGLAALALCSQLYPSRFILHGVTYQESTMEQMGNFQIVKGFMGAKAIQIKFLKKSKKDEQSWFCKIMLWAQLSHENVLPFYGLCPINNKDYFPGLVTPWAETVYKFLENSPDPTTQRSLIHDIAAGMAFLHGMLIHGWIRMSNIFVTNTGHACLASNSSLSVNPIDPSSETLWPVNDRDNFLKIHHQLHLFGSEYHGSQSTDVDEFIWVSYQILMANQPWFANLNDMISDTEDTPINYLYEGFDIWQLLQDCRMKDPNARPTAQEIVTRLEGAREQLVIQRHAIDSIIESAIVYWSLKKSGNDAEVTVQASKLYQSLLVMFHDLTKYGHFLSCRGKDAQALIDIMQVLLDTGFVEQQFRNVFIFVLAALAMHAKLYPKRFVLHSVTYEESSVEDTSYSQIVKGLREGDMVRIEFLKQSTMNELSWFCSVIVWAQLSQDNVLPFYGICHHTREGFFPGIVSPWPENGGVKGFLERNPNTDRQSLVCDIAAGLAYLHDSGLIHGKVNTNNILITGATSPHACLAGCGLSVITIDPGSMTLWSEDDKHRFFRIHRELHPLVGGYSLKDDVLAFAGTSYSIATDAQDFGKIIHEGKPVRSRHGHMLNDSMWQLLLDCWNPDTCFTARYIVHRLDQQMAELTEEKQRLIKKKEQIVLLLSAIFSTEQHYRDLLHCNDNDAQELLDSFQLLLDIEDFHKLDRKQLIAALQRFSKKRNLYPSHFFLHGPVPVMQDIPFTSGGFADIYKVKFQGEDTCFKVIRVYEQSGVECLTKIYAREAIVWAQLSHPNILPFYGISEFHTQLAFVSRWATNGHVNDYLAQNTDANRVLLCSDTAAGVEYLHKNDIIHGDLKGCNVLIDNSGRASVADFGLANVTDPRIIKWTSQSTIASKGGTPRWQAPELFESEDMIGEIYNTKASDVFAWASVCYEIFTGHLPFFQVQNPVTVMNMIMQGETPTRPEDGDPAWQQHGLNSCIWDLMKDCWRFESSERPDMTLVISRLDPEKPNDTRPPGEWDGNALMRFHNAEDAKRLKDSLSFWEGLRSLLLQVVPGIEEDAQ